MQFKKSSLVLLSVVLSVVFSIVFLAAGTSSCSSNSGEWYTNIDRAVEQAGAENKIVFVHFTGSDWCKWCKVLKKEVFSTDYWKSEAPKHMVFVRLDFPRQTELPQEQQTYNRSMAEKYSVRGFPTILLLDSSGMPFAKTGYQRGGSKAYLEHILDFQKRTEKLARLEKALTNAQSDKKKVDILESLIEATGEWGFGSFYRKYKEQAVSIDDDNSLGVRDKYQVDLRIQKLAEKHLQKNDIDGFEQVLKEMAKEHASGEPAQLIYYYLAIVASQKQEKQQMQQYLQRAKSYAPDSTLAVRIDAILEQEMQ